MTDLTLVGLCGSLRAASYNRQLMVEAAGIFGGRFVEGSLRLPLFDEDLEAEGIDLRICYGGEHPDYRIEELFRDRLVPVAATEAPLSDMPLVAVNWGVSISSVPGWAQYFAAYPQTNRGPALYTVASVPAAVSLVQAGLGAALLPERVLAGELAAGRLVRLPGGAIEMPRPYVAVSAHHNVRSRRLSALLEALRG